MIKRGEEGQSRDRKVGEGGRSGWEDGPKERQEIHIN